MAFALKHTPLVPATDAPQQGEALHALATELFPITRSLTGPGYRETLDRLEAVCGSMERHRFATGEQVFDWTVPDEWTIRDAWVKGPDGETVVSLADHNLHLVSYSEPVHARMPLEELQAHLHSLPDQPDAIPYRTSYYAKGWGFCLADRQRQSLAPGEYEILVDADLAPGHLEVGEVVIAGETDEQVLFSTYCCHPSMANNELSGPVVAAHLAARIRAAGTPRLTYRFVFLPETIGAIAYLSRVGDDLLARLVAGYVMTCMGDPGVFTYKRSRRGDSLADRVALHVLEHGGEPFGVVPFVPSGSDERQYCSPGFDLPVGSLMRTMYGVYPEYHTSLDDLELVTADALGGSLRMYARVVEALEANEVLRNTQPFCEPQLSPRGLYPTTGGGLGDQQALRDLMAVLNFCDGTQDLLAVAERTGRPIAALAAAVTPPLDQGLLARA